MTALERLEETKRLVLEAMEAAFARQAHLGNDARLEVTIRGDLDRARDRLTLTMREVAP